MTALRIYSRYESINDYLSRPGTTINALCNLRIQNIGYYTKIYQNETSLLLYFFLFLLSWAHLQIARIVTLPVPYYSPFSFAITPSPSSALFVLLVVMMATPLLMAI